MLRFEVAALRTANADLRAALDHERAQATRVTRTLALPGPAADPPRGRWPWSRNRSCDHYSRWDQHLAKHLGEFAFRYNHRTVADQMFARLIGTMA